MLKQLKKSQNEGFTIIEVMIVLAIAGLILLIVLLAVPALQRNARNTTVKNDASAFSAGFAEYASNNDGGTPASPLPAQNSSTVLIGAAAAAVAQATVKVSANTTVNVAKVNAQPGFAAGQLWWRTGQTCGAVNNSRAIVVYYGVETSNGGQVKCIDAE